MTSVLLRLARSTGGEAMVSAILERSGSPHEASYLESVDNWISLDEAHALLQAGVTETRDQLFARRVGEQTLHQHSGTQVATLLRSLGSLEAVLRAVTQTAGKVSTVTDMDALEVGPGHALISAVAHDGFTRRSLQCDWTAGLLSGTPVLFGLPYARVEETECQARGDARCLYTVTWDAELAANAADPQQRVTALEAQLVAMSERLQSVYATAGDLVSTEDLDTVLHRIVERAASAVRAPSHILAVRPEPDADLQVYSRGIDPGEAQKLAHAPLSPDSETGSSNLVAEVTSSRRHYGRLIARYPGTNRFFPQEQEMLNLYAKHAAAVLDMAMALQESAQRHDQVSSLLSLSHALSQAGTSLEVAERLATAVPEVIDCDRIAVWLWDESNECLRTTAAWGRTPTQQASLDEVTVSPTDTPHLGRMLTEPQPHFFQWDTDDPFLHQMMLTLDVVTLVVVPIIARDEFLGVLTVSVKERPQRLHPDNDLIERLTGVAALAAPAIQNGHLVDQLSHKASHDGLTGLLNLMGFRAHIDNVLTRVRAGQEQVGLLFVDLNEFKRVNDVYGHEAGDELLRQTAERLDAIGRGGDEVARLGGDEFAIILDEVERVDQVRSAEQRVRDAFTDPFLLGEITVSMSTSVGGVIWPDDGDTITELVRRADAAMYRDKADLRRAAKARPAARATATSPSA